MRPRRSSTGVTQIRVEWTNLFLPFDHPFEERFKGVLEVLDTLLLEARHFRLHEARDVVELLLGVERAALRLADEVQRARELLGREPALRAARLVRLLRASQVRVGILPCVICAHTGAEGELDRAQVSNGKACVDKTAVH